MQDSLKPVQEKKEWRVLFPSQLLSKAQSAVESGCVRDLVTTESSAAATFAVKTGRRFEVSIQGPESFYDNWDDKKFRCTCLTKRKYYHHIGGWNRHSEVCHHEAAVLMAWEAVHSPWVFDEPPELREQRRREAEERERAKELERQRRAEQARKKAEQERLRAEVEAKKNRKQSAASFFAGKDPAGSFFKLRRALRNSRTDAYAAEQAKALLEKDAAALESVSRSFSRDGSPSLFAQGNVLDGKQSCFVQLELLPDELESHRCSCRPSYYYPYSGSDLCGHELALLALLGEYIRRENPGDATDRAASAFLEAMDRLSARQEAPPDEETPRPKCISLQPRLMLDNGVLALSYKIGAAGGKSVLLRSYHDFLRDYEARETFRLSAANSIDFGAFELTDDSLPWLTFLQRRMSETEVANDSLNYYSGQLKVKTRDILAGAVLDRFYELAEGTAVEFSGPGKKDAGQLSVGHAALRVPLRTERIPESGSLLGIEISGRMPVILRGSAGSYMLIPASLSKITKEEEQALRPFREASDKNGNIRFRIGREKLAEYYYRVVPQLRQSPCIDL